MVAAHILVSPGRNTLPFQADSRVRLRAGLDIINHLAVHGIDEDRTAKGRHGEGDGNHGIDVKSVSLELLMARHDAFHADIASRAAINAGISEAGQIDCLTVIDAGRDVDIVLLSDGNIALSGAIRALLADDLAGAVTVGTNFRRTYHAQHGLSGAHHLSPASAGRAGLRAGSRLGTASLTLRAGLLNRELNLLLAAEDRLLEGKAHGRADIGSLHGTVARRTASGAAKSTAEQIAEDIAETAENIAEIHSGEVVSAGSASFEGRMSELIVLPPLLGIAQDRIGFRSFLEFGLCLLVTGIGVRMVLLGKHAVGLLQGRVICIFIYSEDLIVVPLLLCHLFCFLSGEN